MNKSTYQPIYNDSWAIIIGINKYAYLQSLVGAENDATSLAELLQVEYKFPVDNTILLLNEAATQTAIREHLELIVQRSKENDRFIFYFAGHGNTRPTPEGGDVGYLATVESIHDKWHTFIRIDEITRYSGLIPAKHIIYIFDACFGGLALSRGSTGLQKSDIRNWLADCMTHRVRQVLTAGLAEQPVGDLTEDGHSIFTSYLLKGLQGAAIGSEGELTASQLMFYVTDSVMKDIRSKQKPASGDIEDTQPGGDMVFKNPALHYFTIPASKEGGINTGIYLKPNDKISVIASGVISYDSWHHFTNADGMLTTYKGQPLAHPQEVKPIAWPHPDAYQTNGNRLGLIGSLFGWTGNYSEQSAFYLGESSEVVINTEGYLYLSVNDAKGTYGDNKGEYIVTVRIL